MKNSKTVIFTDRSTMSVNLLLKDIRNYPLLTATEERDLWQRMQKGCKAARERLINCNMRFVVSMAKKYLWSGVSLDDLIICGAIGLTLAVDRFDATRGYRFLSFAVWWIDAELKKAVTDHWPYQQMASLDAPLDAADNDCSDTLLDILHNNSVCAPDWALTYLSEIAATKERIRKRHFDEAASIFEDALEMNAKGLTLFDIARKHRVSEEQVRQLLKMIRTELESDFSSPSYRLAA